MLKKILLLGAVVLGSYNLSYSAEVLVEPSLSKFCVRTYNSLSSVEAANAGLLESGNLDSFLAEASSLVSAYDSVDFLGVRLVHKHNSLVEGDIMLEEFTYDEGEPALVTSDKSITTEGAIPASWVMTPTGLRAFEYSIDSAVSSGLQYLAEHPEFMSILASTIQKYALESHLAPAVLRLDAFGNFDSTHHLVETSRVVTKSGKEMHENVVKGVPDAVHSTLNIIKTSWGLGGEVTARACIRWCDMDQYGHLGAVHMYR